MSAIIASLITFLLYAVTFVMSLVEHRISRGITRILLVIMLFVVVVIINFRGFGLDYANYEFYYNNLYSASDIEGLANSRLEPGFYWLVSLANSFGLNFDQFYIIILTFIVFLSFSVFGFDNLNFKSLFIFLGFFFIGYLDVVRGAIASVLVLLFIRFFSKKSYIKSAIVFVFGVSIHYSFLLVLIIPILIRLRFTAVSYIFASITVIVTSTILSLYVPTLIESNFIYEASGKLSYALKYLSEVGSTPANGFLNYTHMVSWYSYVYSFCFFTFFINLFYLTRSKSEEHDEFLCSVHYVSCWGSLFFFFFFALGYGVFAARISYLFSFGAFFLLYRSIFNGTYKNKGSKQNLYYIVAVVLTLNFVLSFLYIGDAFLVGAKLYIGL